MLDEKNELQDSLPIYIDSDDTIKTSVDNPAAETKIKINDLVEEVALESLVEADDYSGPHDEFDWSISKKNTVNYSPEVVEKMLKDYDLTLSSISEGQIIEGIVASISGGDVIFDIRYKSDGLIPASEFRDQDLKPGDKIEIYVERTEDEKGHLVLSRKKAKLLRAWENLVDSYKNGTIIKGNVISKTKGGLIVDCNGLETFLPGSQIDIKPIIDYDAYVGKVMEFKVVKINENIKNAVVSHKALIEGDLQEQRELIIQGLEKGQVLEGVIKNITDFGAFLDLGGVDGLLYITDISWGRITHPSEVLERNQKINVVVLDFDENKKRISLGLKQLQPHPWEVLPEDLVEGATVKGKIVNIEDYGAFLEIQPGIEGLIHVSEINWNNQPIHAKEFFFLGQELEAKVVTIDKAERKMSLSLKLLTEDPWGTVQSKFSVGTKHTGIVKNLTLYGVFVELSEGIGGMIHISDLSWTKRFNHPSEFTKVGQSIDVIILDIDLPNRKLSLGHKQLEENPWDTFETVFPEGSYHTATVIKKDDKGFIVQLPYGLEAFGPLRHMKKENNQNVALEETLTVKVIEFNRDEKKILVSHTRYLEDIKKEADDNIKKEKVEERQQTKKSIDKQQSKMEVTTLGEIEGFSALKDQLSSKSEDATPTPEPIFTPPAITTASVVEEQVVEKVSVPEKTVVKKVANTEKVVAEKVADTEEAIDTVSKKPAKSKKSSEGDDLKLIEGIGPKIAELLIADGITTFKQLSKTSVDAIKACLDKAGPRYRIHDPSTWPEQAGLASEGRMDELKVLQEHLKGGKKE
ncbi:MAG: 30S ribosomal protein S1 [Saprospiraceae bacterium]